MVVLITGRGVTGARSPGDPIGRPFTQLLSTKPSQAFLDVLAGSDRSKEEEKDVHAVASFK